MIIQKRKIRLSFVSMLLLMLVTQQQIKAQANWEAGIRFGDNFSVDLTLPISMDPRIHTAVYFDRFGIGGYFDWMFALNGGPDGLKFYPGVGPEMFFDHGFDLNVAGDFGAEYSFKFPLTVGIDWRPHIALTDDFDFRASNWGFIARFRFGEGTSFKRVNK